MKQMKQAAGRNFGRSDWLHCGLWSLRGSAAQLEHSEGQSERNLKGGSVLGQPSFRLNQSSNGQPSQPVPSKVCVQFWHSFGFTVEPAYPGAGLWRYAAECRAAVLRAVVRCEIVGFHDGGTALDLGNDNHH